MNQENETMMEEKAEEGLSIDDFSRFLREIKEQPPFRRRMDKEMDYCDGNQLDSELLAKMRERGIPGAIENNIKPSIEAIMGQEAKNRTDWRVTPDGSDDGEDVALALNELLNEAERKSRADRGCSEAYYGQVSVGLGWLEVSREKDPFKYPYRCTSINRNEISYDWNADSNLLDDARYLIRTKWVDKDVAKAMFPDHKDVLEYTISGFIGMDINYLDGGHSTGLVNAMDAERGFSVEEQEWRDRENRRIRLFEVWTRKWENVLVINTPDGRIVELDQDNPIHFQAIAYGIEPKWKTVARVRCSWWAGPHKLSDEESPYKHGHFPYVPFFGHREDRTKVPYGRIRGMMYLQDAINATIAKIRWGLSATVITRTKGAVAMKDEQFRRMVARPDADIILDQQEMAKPGATFKIDRNFELNQQQYQMLQDARDAISKAGGVSNEFIGAGSSATSGIQENARIEQSQQGLAELNDKFQEARERVGELLLSMIIDDNIGIEKKVLIKGNGIKEDRTIVLNEKAMDEEEGYEYLNNDLQRTMLKVVLEEVPSTSSFRTQQLSALSEAYKTAPPQAQAIILPHLLNLTDIPNKKDILDALQNASTQPTPEMQQLQIKQMEMDAKIKLVEAQAVKTLNEAQYNALQTAQVLAQIPATAPIADKVLENSGYVQPTPSGQDPGFSDLELANQQIDQMKMKESNTNPMTPKPPMSPDAGAKRGIETKSADGVYQ